MLVGVALAIAPMVAGKRTGGGVAICQVPPGNPANFFTTYVGSPKALAGPCNENCNALCNDDPCKIYTRNDCEGEGCIEDETSLVDKCDDNDPCTVDSCNSITGECTNERLQNCCTEPSPKPAGSTCSVGDPCTGGSNVDKPLCKCSGGTCTDSFCLETTDDVPEGTGLCVNNFSSGAACSTTNPCSDPVNNVCVNSCSGFLCVSRTLLCEPGHISVRHQLLRHVMADEQEHSASTLGNAN
jgi:hypothetical protein